MDVTGTGGRTGPSFEAHTEVLDAPVAAALADPGAMTQVISAAPVIGADGAGVARGGIDHGVTVPAMGPPPLVSRRVAAEIGMYMGAGLVLAALGGLVIRGWSTWEPAIRGAFLGLASVALVALGLFIRLPWRRVLSDERRRAVSSMLTTGVAGAAMGVAATLGGAPGVAPDGSRNAGVAGAVVLALAVVNMVARTPLSETVLVASIAWAVWVGVAPGPGAWAFLVALGVLWAGVGMRWARGRRTAGVFGAGLALMASVGMAEGPWAWPTRAALAAVAVLGLLAFVRGRANLWLALGAGASTALAASVAGAVVEPAIALLVGGLATMVVSWVALRSARDS